MLFRLCCIHVAHKIVKLGASFSLTMTHVVQHCWATMQLNFLVRIVCQTPATSMPPVAVRSCRQGA